MIDLLINITNTPVLPGRGKNMNNVIVLGTQWGDEGKGKVADLLTSKANIVVRSQGGNNAGHTLVVGDRKVVVRLVHPEFYIHSVYV